LLKALLDVSAPQETGGQRRGEVVGALAPAQPSMDEQYAAAFLRWGLDVGGTPEDEVVARLGAEPDVVVQELIAALDGWMMERRRQKRPEAEWRPLFRVADRLDRSGRHRPLRALLAGGSPPRPESVAGLVGAGSPWAALWELSRGTDWRLLQPVRGDIDPASEPVMTVVLLAQACATVGDDAGAEQVLRQAAAARPDQVALLDALGKLLERQGPSRRGKAIEYYRAARARRPGLGIALSAALIRAGRADEAEEVLQELTRQQPDNPAPYNTLGISLSTQRKFGAAEAAFRKATELQPDFAVAHYNLGLTLASQGRHGAAEAAYRKAIELRPDFVPTYIYLSEALLEQAKFDEALAFIRKGHDLLPARDPLREQTRPLLQRCQRYKALAVRLPRIMKGAEKPASAAEQIEFAELCRLKELYAAAARFYAAAFAEEPQLAQDVPKGVRYNAACAAAQAGCALGRDTDTLDDKERARWRRQAREWLREDLTWWGKALDKGNAQTKADVRWQMQFWQSDRDLAGLREPGALEALSPDEHKECLALWQEVTALLGRVQMTK
jgi:Flp pilus assembly protein TadD